MPRESPHDTLEIAPGTVVDGRYKVVRSIGQGGNGIVYEVEHARTGRKLALKALLAETGFARLEQEARAASVMKNGHTARIIDMEPSGPTGAYMVMELLEGQSLRALLDDAGQLPLELTVNIAMQVCECLHEAHGLGIIHRDLKPENVFLCPSPWPGQYDVKVLDFGVMKIAGEGGAIPKSSLTRTGSTVGTPYYMSLEQLRNSSAVDARADVYSLGVVLYECLSGRKPFQADTIGDLVYALCSGPPTQLTRLRPDLPAEIADFVMRTLSANREDRPASMLDLAITLLPHANPAFALWVRVDGKQPALARAPTSSPPVPPRPAPAAAPRAPVVPGSSPANSARLKTAVLETKQPPQGIVKPSDAGRASEPEEGRRDTPTEMYVKGVHGPIVDRAEEPEPERGDRDTPTRAIEMASLPGTSPPRDAQAEDDVPDVPTIDMPGARAKLLGGNLAQHLDAGVAPGAPMLQPNSATAKLTMPLGGMLPSIPDIPPTGAPVEPPLAAPKPKWQVTLDRALIGVGGFGERQIVRFRTAPQNTQIIVMIIAGTATILVLGFVVFLSMR